MESGDLAAKRFSRQALVQAVKKGGAAITPPVGQKSTADVRRLGFNAGAPKALGSIEPVPFGGRMGGCQAVQDLA
jgi:hypothetical protein